MQKKFSVVLSFHYEFEAESENEAWRLAHKSLAYDLRNNRAPEESEVVELLPTDCQKS